MYALRVEGEPQSAKIRNALKSFASRSWNRPGRDGSTRWLWKDQDLREDMAVKIWQCLWAVISDAARSLFRSHLSKHPSSCRAPGAHCL